MKISDISHVVSDNEGKRLDIYLAERFSITRTKAKALIEAGHVLINGKSPKTSLKVKKNMEITGEITEEEPLTLTPHPIPLQILYEDEYLLAINKPAGMVVHPSFGHREGTLVNAVLAYLGHDAWGTEKDLEISIQNPASARPGIVHRLDKGTTGVIMVAKDTGTQEMLSALFKDRNLKKTYRAVVEGTLKNDTVTIEGNIGRHPIERKKMALLKKGGRDALTTVRVLQRLKGFTYIEAFPRTGRTHQIRVHLSHAGYPIVGDDIYGRKSRHLADRPLLHAYKIEFVHPVKNIPVSIYAPVPDDMTDFIESQILADT